MPATTARSCAASSTSGRAGGSPCGRSARSTPWPGWSRPRTWAAPSAPLASPTRRRTRTTAAGSYQRSELLTRRRARSLAAPEAVDRRCGRSAEGAMTVAITRKEPGAGELRREARRCRDARAARRMLALALVLEGSSREEAARAAGMDRQTLRDWVHRYNAEGLAGLHDRHRSGRKPRLTPEQEAELARPWSRGRTWTGTAWCAGAGSTSKR